MIFSFSNPRRFWISFIFYSIFFGNNTFCQTTIILRPGTADGKDAYLRSLSPNNNYGNHIDFLAHSWTNGGQDLTVRGLIDFDLSQIPPSSVIDSAFLSLYSYDSPANGHHETTSGSNEAVLKRVIQSWSEFTVTWNNQPGTTTNNQTFLPATTLPIQHYENIDIKYLVQDMIDDPLNSHGFLFKLKNEQKYRRMLFSSSDNPDSTLHPKLEITYSNPLALEAKKDYSDLIEIRYNSFSNAYSIYYLPDELGPININIEIFNLHGKKVFSSPIKQNERIFLPSNSWPSGFYLIRGFDKFRYLERKNFIVR